MKVECPFCHEMYWRNPAKMCESCTVKQIERATMSKQLDDITSKEAAQKEYDEFVKTINYETATPEVFEKKRILRGKLNMYL